jgi:hypothetical protein
MWDLNICNWSGLFEMLGIACCIASVQNSLADMTGKSGAVESEGILGGVGVAENVPTPTSI